MKAETIKNRIAEMVTLFGFEYRGKAGNVDPCYSTENGDTFLLFFDGEEQTVTTIDEVMNTPFIDGKTLSDVAEELEITDF